MYVVYRAIMNRALQVAFAAGLLALACYVSFHAQSGPAGVPYEQDREFAGSLDGGLQATMQISPGPYFLGDTLTATVTLRNNARTPFILDGRPSAQPCDASVWVELLGGSAPSIILDAAGIGCTGPEPTPLAPGQSITVRVPVTLTASGHVLLVARVALHQMYQQHGRAILPPSPIDPLDGHWPTKSIEVDTLTVPGHISG